jgi:hypothetical protein
MVISGNGGSPGPLELEKMDLSGPPAHPNVEEHVTEPAQQSLGRVGPERLMSDSSYDESDEGDGEGDTSSGSPSGGSGSGSGGGVRVMSPLLQFPVLVPLQAGSSKRHGSATEGSNPGRTNCSPKLHPVWTTRSSE